MRKLLTLTVLAVAAASVPALALAKPGPRKPPKRVGSHVSLHVTKHHAVRGRRIVVRGRVRPRGAHRVKVVVRGPRGAVRGTTSSRGGGWSLRWRPRRTGAYRLRAYAVHDRRIRGSASVARRVTAYRRAEASYYGPGLYGGGMACGGTLQPGTIGVAHRTLPCGSRLKLRYGGRTVGVRVVDRGPYIAGREFDLTAATRARLGFPSTGVLLSSR